ncbi:non-ribosomal peptide synthetase [Polyangium sp. 6x1]|uniref:non-ribosomal peptide synthetase n=1 Tax=Polyangium sp. 6x1 TaxID=3042689 RepID=UPI00248295B2|nr:non-ribosomal peptide synthetase [Polyangium sp. 6x1]MDI1443025.1 amino acid adenylation domain-containing protein [Polyangium sp. 6x1]
MTPPKSLVDLLRGRAERDPDRRAYTYLLDEGGEVHATYAEMDRTARAIGALLQQEGATGSRALLLYPPGMEFVQAFYGCLYGGVVAVPTFPPDLARYERTIPRLRALLRDAAPTVVLTTTTIRDAASALLDGDAELASIRWLATDALDSALAGAFRDPDVGQDSLAFLQYTSGSTGTPRGVMLTHGNLLHNTEVIRRGFGARPDSVGVIWLPPYHDMGLIGGILVPLYVGMQTALMSPLAFLQRPMRWLEAISALRGTVSGGPNFAFELCARKSTPEQRAALDLSSWEVAFCGAEPIRAHTPVRFAELFGPSGFRKSSFYPCYGLAEATLMVTGGDAGAEPSLRSFDENALSHGRAAVPQEGAPARTLVSSGRSAWEFEVLVVDPERGVPRAAGEIGEIWVRGPSVAQGYWKRPEETARTFGARRADTGDGPYLRTGDLGFLDQGEVFVAGRLKDLIIVRGTNHYPQDIELTAERSHPALRPGSGAAFSIEVEGEERLVVVHELDRGAQDPAEIGRSIRRAIAEAHDLQTYAVALVRRGSMHKTSSGKIQRRACRQSYLEHTLELVWSDTAEVAPAPLGTSAPTAPVPREDVPRYVHAVIADALRASPEKLDARAPLTAAGVDSLTAVEIKHRIDETYGVDLPLSGLLGGATIAEIAARVTERLDGSPAPAPITASPATESEAPLSHAQSAQWFLYRLDPDNRAYNIAFGARIAAGLDVPSLRRALATVVARHPALRTVYGERDGEPFQRVRSEVDLDFEVVDASPWDAPTLQAQASAEAYRPFDLEHGPVLRVRLFTRSDEHVLLVAVHHIAVDFWSIMVLLDELLAAYAADRASAPFARPEVAVRFTDFVRWQEKRLAGPFGEQLWSYWRARLDGLDDAPALPIARAAMPGRSRAAGTVRFELDPDLSARLVRLAKDEQATPYALLLAAFQALLHRYGGEDEVVVGTPAAGRSRPELAGVIGHFVNMLVLRANVDGAAPFQKLVAQACDAVTGALEHQELPFPLLVERLRPHRDGDRSPLLRTVFALQKPHRLHEAAAFVLGHRDARVEVAGLSLAPFPIERKTAAVDLTMTLVEADGGFSGTLEYDADLFDAEDCARLVEHYRRILRAIAADPSVPVSRLALLSPEERSWLREHAHGPSAAYPRACLHALFEEHARRTPEATAVLHAGERLAYGELNRRANQLARHLRTLGVGAGTPVALLLDRGTEIAVALLGVLKAGGAYLPLDPSHPGTRLAAMIEDASAPALVTQSRMLDRLPARSAAVVCLDLDEAALAAQDGENLELTIGPEEPAYLIYTSGSTGRPKGVLVPHRGAINLLAAVSALAPLPQAPRASAWTSVGFDVSVYEIFSALCSGGSVDLVPEDIRADAGAFCRWLSDRGIQSAYVPATMLPDLLAAPVASLGRLLVGVEPIDEQLLVELRRRIEGLQIVNGYGPTETSICATLHPVPRDVSARGRTPIGRPVQNSRCYVLDPHGELSPIGIPGELYVAGDGVALGYFGAPALTTERFLPDPLFPELGARAYRTGDIVRWRGDGELVFVGRRDRQIKLRGFRIELDEIEAVLHALPEVREAAASVLEVAPGDRRLIAHAALRQEGSATGESLRAALGKTLPGPMVPSAIVLRGALPRTPNGKIDHRALPPPAPEDYGVGSAPIRTATEAALAEIFGQVLGYERVGDDDFFALGGHSLNAAQVVARVRHVFGVELPLRAIFEARTVSRLAERIDVARKAQEGADRAPIARVGRDGPQPASFAQQRLWFLDRFAPGSPAYNLPAALRLTGALDVAALEGAIVEVVQRHEALRTTMAEIDWQIVQHIEPAPNVRLVLRDLRALPEEARRAEAHRLAEEEARAPFDLARGPLLRATLLRLDEHEHVLLLTLHHAISDGWSVGVLAREITSLYAEHLRGEASRSSPLPLQYADWATWQRERLQGPRGDELLAYWTGKLAGAPATLDLPTDRPRSPEPTFAGARVAVEVPAALARAVAEAARQRGATLFMALYVAYAALLSRSCGTDDVVIGTPVANRDRAETEDLIGLFANTLVLRTDLSGRPGFGELLARAREATLSAYAHQDMPFERLVEALSPDRTATRTPFFSVMFALQNAPFRPPALAGLTVEPLDVHTGTAKCDLSLSLTEAEDGSLRGDLEYATELFDRERIERLVAHFRALLAWFVEDLERPFDEAPLLSADERRELLETWNDTATGYPREACVHTLFQEQVARTPERIAVVFEGRELTYRAVAQRVGRLADELRARGVGPGTLVGVLLERSEELVVTLLAVLAAGGAYVPLDPEHPTERIASILEDARPALLVTDERSPKLPFWQGPTVRPSEGRGTHETRLAPRADGGATAEDLAYVIFTSGSTGRPKGVQISHRSVVNFLCSMRQRPWLREGDTLLAVTTASFDIAVLELFLPLVVGAKVEIASRTTAADGPALLRALQTSGARVMQATPVTWRMLVAAGFRGAPGFIVLCGGEALPRSLADALLEGGSSVWNLYGPTETTIWSTVHEVGPGRGAVVPIGRPIANTRVYVLGPRKELLPAGVPGELYIGGDGVARGYLNRPELTAERFVADPFVDSPGARMYRTGDRARWLREGSLEYLGREDHQIKLRGFRIELGEIEAALRRYPDVRSSVVVARKGRDGDDHLVAYLVAPGAALSAQALRSFLQDKLPAYMIPSSYVALDELPLTPNGKIDRRALPEPDALQLDRGQAFVEPRTEVERTLAAIWAEVLGVERVGLEDNFFDLGGHSLLAVQLLGRARAATGVELPLRRLFAAPTLGAMAALVEEESRAGADQELLELQALLASVEAMSSEQAADAVAGEPSAGSGDSGRDQG